MKRAVLLLAVVAAVVAVAAPWWLLHLGLVAVYLVVGAVAFKVRASLAARSVA